MTPLHAELVAHVRQSGPITVAKFMELALYHPEHGYYATAPQRSGRGGDFFTSVDVGSLFGELIAVQLAEMWALLERDGAEGFDLVEAGAGNGRLARDILDAAAVRHRDLYDRSRVTLIEVSAAARAEQPASLGPHAERLHASTAALPDALTGVIVANELLDALPVHVVSIGTTGPREIYVGERAGALVEIEGSLSDPRIASYLDRYTQENAALRPGSRLEVGLQAIDWVARAASALERGFLLLFDYGHRAAELYSPAHQRGTLLAYRAHQAGVRHWLEEPGCCDLTAHVNLTAVREAAEAADLETLGMIDQTYFLIALGLVELLGDTRRTLAGKTLIMPGGLGSTMKVMLFSKGLGRPALRGLSSGRLT